jgi:subtilisin family serine protease
MQGRSIHVLLAITLGLLAYAPAGAVASAAPLTAAATIAAPAATAPRDTGVVIVKFRTAPSAAARRALGLQDAPALAGPDLVSKAAPRGTSASEYARRLSRSPLVEYAEPDYLLRPTGYTYYTSEPNDPDFLDPSTYSWELGSVAHAMSWPLRDEYSSHFDAVWPALATAKATGGEVRVAVIDTGFYTGHPDAGENIHAAIDECASYSPVTGTCTTDTVVEPVSASAGGNDTATAAHGTMTASEIGAGANNAVGTLGAAYDTWTDVYKVQGVASASHDAITKGDAVIPESAVARAIRDATDDAVRVGYGLVINMSLEVVGASPAVLRDAVAYAHDRGVVIVAASGNSDRSTVSYPAAYPGVLAVGAYRLGDSVARRAPFSNYGSALDLLAPGTMVWGPTRPGAANPGDPGHTGYTWWNGTSMAAPFVASAAALLLRTEPSLTSAEVESYLEAGATDMGAVGWDEYSGAGRLDAYRSYYLLAAPRTTADIRTRYALQATIDFTVSDSDSGPDTVTYYQIDGGSTLSGPSVTSSGIGPHTLAYWSVDSNGVTEATHIATFTVTLADTAPPVTVSDARPAYSGVATIHLTASDSGPADWGVAHTYYRIDGEATRTATVASVGSAGDHTLTYWSTDQAGNVESPHTAAFTVSRATATATISRSSSTIRRGSRIKLSGTLVPALKGDVVRIQYRPPGSSTWRYFTTKTSVYRRVVTSVASSGRGTWSPLSYPLSKHGRYYFRAVFSGDDTGISRTSATSGSVSVAVR